MNTSGIKRRMDRLASDLSTIPEIDYYAGIGLNVREPQELKRRSAMALELLALSWMLIVEHSQSDATPKSPKRPKKKEHR